MLLFDLMNVPPPRDRGRTGTAFFSVPSYNDRLDLLFTGIDMKRRKFLGSAGAGALLAGAALTGCGKEEKPEEIIRSIR